MTATPEPTGSERHKCGQMSAAHSLVCIGELMEALGAGDAHARAPWRPCCFDAIERLARSWLFKNQIGLLAVGLTAGRSTATAHQMAGASPPNRPPASIG